MNEDAARDIALVRAIEVADPDGALISAEDRRYASRAASELAHWSASQQRTAATPESFLARRAALLLDKIGSDPIVRLLRARRWHPWIGILLPLAAALIGAIVEQVTDRQHINVLAFPLMAIIAWNLVVYVLLVLRPLLGAGPGPAVRRLIGRVVPRESNTMLRASRPMSVAAGEFASEWSRQSSPLAGARIARVLHLSAAAFAIGAVVGMYLRAVVFEYRIGWESTYLQAPAVHSILRIVLGPAARLIGMPFPTVDQVAAMRLTGGAGGVDAGPWIHLYAVSVGIAVVLPRLLLALWARWRELRLAAGFAIPLDVAYFRRVLAGFSESATNIQVAPYSYTLGASEIAGLERLARHLFGDRARLSLRPNIPFGEEERAADGLLRRQADIALTFAVFNASATPENENHGAFVDVLREALDMPVGLIVDTAPYRQRLGSQAGS